MIKNEECNQVKQEIVQRVHHKVDMLIKEINVLDEEAVHEVELLARLGQVLDSVKTSPRRRRWPLILLFGMTLSIFSILFFTRIPQTEVEIELEVSEAKWKVSKQRVLLDGIRLKSLGISDVGHIKGYLDNQAHTQLSSMTTDSNASIKFIADESSAVLNMGAVVVKPGTIVRLRSIGEKNKYQLSLNGKDISVPINLLGRIAIKDRSDPKIFTIKKMPRGLHITPKANEIDLDIELHSESSRNLAGQIEIDALELSTIAQEFSSTISIVHRFSTIQSGIAFFPEFKDRTHKLRAGEVLSLHGVNGELATTQLNNNGIALRYRGLIKDVNVGWGEHPRSLMPTWLEYLQAKHGLSLLWGSAIYVFGLLVVVIRWWGIKL